MKQYIKEYIESNSNSWSETTLKSEEARLNKVLTLTPLARIMEDPGYLFDLLKVTHKPYAIKTIFIRLKKFVDWLIAHNHMQGVNPYRLFMMTHGRLFKHVYQKEEIEVTYQEALEKLKAIPNHSIRNKAIQLLSSGMRYTESFTLSSGRKVVGKGGKPRTVFPTVNSNYCGTYATFRRELSKIGLKPHTLRKLAATEFVNNGAAIQDLMQLMGWSSMATASSYLQPKKEEQLKQFVQGVYDAANR